MSALSCEGCLSHSLSNLDGLLEFRKRLVSICLMSCLNARALAGVKVFANS